MEMVWLLWSCLPWQDRAGERSALHWWATCQTLAHPLGRSRREKLLERGLFIRQTLADFFQPCVLSDTVRFSNASLGSCALEDCTEPRHGRWHGIAPLSVDVGFTKEYSRNDVCVSQRRATSNPISRLRCFIGH